jgi:hypothetical protein
VAFGSAPPTPPSKPIGAEHIGTMIPVSHCPLPPPTFSHSRRRLVNGGPFLAEAVSTGDCLLDRSLKTVGAICVQCKSHCVPDGGTPVDTRTYIDNTVARRTLTNIFGPNPPEVRLRLIHREGPRLLRGPLRTLAGKPASSVRPFPIHPSTHGPKGTMTNDS